MYFHKKALSIIKNAKQYMSIYKLIYKNIKGVKLNILTSIYVYFNISTIHVSSLFSSNIYYKYNYYILFIHIYGCITFVLC